MVTRFTDFFLRFVKEPPFRLLGQKWVKYLSASPRTKADWDAVERPHYLVGLLKGADQARAEGIERIAAIEFGVASGNGLVLLQQYADDVERETGVQIEVYGFDTGQGLPTMSQDFRDHPDQWRPMDYPMDEKKLRARLNGRTQLVLGDVAQTVPRFVEENEIPIGFVAFDLDLYSSTMHAFEIFKRSRPKMLMRTPLYFDDIDFFFNHEFAGEIQAIKDFNTRNPRVKIDKWRGLAKLRVFPENPWLEKMFVAHDIEGIARVALTRAPASV